MRIDGEWLLCDDGIVRPVIRGEILAGDGTWKAAEFLVDTGADRTVFSAPVMASLGFPSVISRGRLGGVGGAVDSDIVETQVRLTRELAGKIILRGQYAAVTVVEALDISVLGRVLPAYSQSLSTGLATPFAYSDKDTATRLSPVNDLDS
jgi:predicted aspartyl protease